jgi:hypothetical protein
LKTDTSNGSVRTGEGTARIIVEDGKVSVLKEHCIDEAVTSHELRVIEPGDLAHFYTWAMNPSTGFRWRFGGRTISFDVFAETFWDGVLAQYAIKPRGQASEPVGLVVAYEASQVHGHCVVGVHSPNSSNPAAFTGALMLVDHLFVNFNFRKIYFELPEFNFNPEGGLFRELEREAVYKEFYYFDGRLWDKTVASISREMWMKKSALFQRYGSTMKGQRK